jgi:hypothetical protein
VTDQRYAFDQTVKTPDVAGMMRHQVNNHDRVDKVVVDEQVRQAGQPIRRN